MYRIVVAYDQNRGIGYNNKLPWHFKEDIENFKKLTSTVKNNKKQNAVIMGRKTYESIPLKFRPLKNRLNLILSKTLTLEMETDNIKIFRTIDGLLEYVQKNKKHIETSFVIGGNQIYSQFLDRKLISSVYATEIFGEYKCDTFFPELKNFKPNRDFKDYIFLNNGFEFKQYYYNNKSEKRYLRLMNEIIKNGIKRNDRTNIGTMSVFGESIKYDIRDGTVPLLTTKFIPFRIIVEELLWFIRGSTDVEELKQKKIHIWDHNSSRDFLDGRRLYELPDGDIGAGYGFQLRHFNGEYKTCKDNYENTGFDQLKYVIDLLKNNPTSRRILFNFWNPSMLNKMALPPCHLLYQFYVNTETNELSCCLYQRSSDYFLANNYNAVSAIVLTNMLAYLCGYKTGFLTHYFGDTHIYLNHIEQCKEQLTRFPTVPPQLKIINNDISKIEDFKYSDFKLINYYPQPSIKAPIN
jgi:dihydrofolate reductase/thymidylate synthase